MRIVVTGGTGFIGQALVPALAADGHDVTVLSRNPAEVQRLFPAADHPGVTGRGYTPLKPGDWAAVFRGADAVVHLAGEPINGRWTPATKRAMRDSRWTGTKVLVDAILAAEPRPRTLVSMSAARAYGTSDHTTFDEDSPRPASPDLLSLITQGWEAAALRADAAGLRTVIPRAGVVLDLGPGIRRMLPVLRPFAGGRVGSGQQWFTWIHCDDMVAIIRDALTEGPAAMRGIYNATAPEPVKMDDFTRLLGDVLGSRARVPVPGFIIERFLGDGATIVLHGQRVKPRRLLERGFAFRYPEIEGALRAMFRA
jgi:uncharacterized protein (TIGR01777 family)